MFSDDTIEQSQSGLDTVRPVPAADEDRERLHEAPCPMCGRDCDHGRIAVDDLKPPTGDRPYDYQRAHATTSALLNAHHAAMTAAEGDPICPICRAGVSPSTGDAIDVAHLERQRDWSEKTFGPGPRTFGVIDHIQKELLEIRMDPLDLNEWVDVVILALDGAWRAGHEPQAIIDAIKAKQARNEARVWPDWRDASPDKAIEHDRSAETEWAGLEEHLP